MRVRVCVRGHLCSPEFACSNGAERPGIVLRKVKGRESSFDNWVDEGDLWCKSPLEYKLYVAVLTLGALLGAAALLHLADRHGRRKLLPASMLTYSLLYALVCVFAHPAIRYVLLFFAGLAQPLPSALSLIVAAEVCSARARPNVLSLLVGAPHLATLMYAVYFKSLSAQWLLFHIPFVAILVLCTLLAALFIPEMPAFLFAINQDEAAKGAFERIARCNGRALSLTRVGHVDLYGTFVAQDGSFVPRGAWRAKSFKVMVICAVNALPYGALGITFYALAFEQQIGVITLVIVTSSGCFAGVAAFMAIQTLSRRKTFMVGSACFALFFLVVMSVLQHAGGHMLLVKAALALSALGVVAGFASNYAYMFEEQEAKVMAASAGMIVSGVMVGSLVALSLSRGALIYQELVLLACLLSNLVCCSFIDQKAEP